MSFFASTAGSQTSVCPPRQQLPCSAGMRACSGDSVTAGPRAVSVMSPLKQGAPTSSTGAGGAHSSAARRMRSSSSSACVGSRFTKSYILNLNPQP